MEIIDDIISFINKHDIREIQLSVKDEKSLDEILSYLETNGLKHSDDRESSGCLFIEIADKMIWIEQIPY